MTAETADAGDVRHHQELLRAAVARDDLYPEGRFEGRGIVICAGGARLLTCAWVLVNMLRGTLDCNLPIELWHLGPQELGPIEEALFADLDVTAVDALEVRKRHPMRTLGGWELKPYAIANSGFREVLLLDADNVPVIDPSFLFDSRQFAETGLLLWPDVEHLAPDNEIWSIVGLPYRPGAAGETGQIVVDKARCWHALQVALHMNEHSDFYYDHLHGDKETYLLAALLTGQPYAMPKRLPKIVSRTIFQHDFDDRVVFQHRNRAKWVLHGRNWHEPKFVHEDACLRHLEQLRRLWDGTISTLPPRSTADLEVEAELAAQRWFTYTRRGSDSRAFELAPGNRVGEGHGGRERIWYVQDGATLVLGGFAEETCRLQRAGDLWSGTWTVDERFEVELTPLAEPPPPRPVRRDPRTGTGASNPGLRLQGASSTWRYEFVGTLDDAHAQLASAEQGAPLLVLTPLKNAVAHLDTYFAALSTLDYPAERISLGFLVSDSEDGTYETLAARMPELEGRYRRVHLSRKDFGFHMPDGVPRWAPEWQLERRKVMAMSRNQLLFAALRDEDWVLWLDVDVVEYPPDVVRRMLATGRSIVQPHCVREYGGPTFDRNAWRDRGRLHLEDLRGGDDLVRLDSVGGAMLLVDAAAHRNGLVFPPMPYGVQSSLARAPHPVFGVAGEVETEGLGLMAADMGYECWGMPNLEVRHADA
jgi:Anp1/Mannosyltransferase putative